MRRAEIVALQLRDLAVLAQVVLHDAIPGPLRLRIFGIESVPGEPGAMLLRQANALRIDKPGMLDRVDTDPDSRPDPRRSMGVGGDLHPPLMPLVGDLAQLPPRHMPMPRPGVPTAHFPVVAPP